MKRLLPFFFLAVLCQSACTGDDPQPSIPKIRFKLRIDPDQVRLDNFGQPSAIPSIHAAQTPVFHKLCVHYIEFTPLATTLLGNGDILYKAPEIVFNGQTAIDFDQAIVSSNDSVFLELPINALAPGSYSYVRASLAYQNYDIRFNLRGVPIFGDILDQSGTIASFVGFNTFISDYTIRNQTVAVNDVRAQGYWGFEPNLSAPYNQYYSEVSTGQAPPGSTTVPNPIWQSSPIPAGSCVVTGIFAQPFVITGQETSDITVVLSVSVNNSFEWVDKDNNGSYDIRLDGGASDQVVDMGLRGLRVFVE